MVILQVDDLDELASPIETHDVRVVFTAARPNITGIHLHPKDVGAAILSVDQTDQWDDCPGLDPIGAITSRPGLSPTWSAWQCNQSIPPVRPRGGPRWSGVR